MTFLFNFKILWTINIQFQEKFFKVIEVLTSLAIASKLIYVTRAFTIKSLAHTLQLKMDMLYANISMWLKQDLLSFFIHMFSLVFGLTPLTVRLTSLTFCQHLFFEVFHLLRFCTVSLRITRIFILLVVVYILVYMIICLINFHLIVFLAFS